MTHVRLRVAVASFLLAGLVGCTSSNQVVEPETDYVEMRPLLYDYGTVYDCVAEAITEEGFQVKQGDRSRGTIETAYVPGEEDHVRHSQKGVRVKAKVVQKGPKDFIVRITATRLERDIQKDNQPGDWRYVSSDQDLIDRLKARFNKQVDKRYKAGSDH